MPKRVPVHTVYNKTVFSRFFASDSPEVMKWANNVLEKVKSSGILPIYVDKNTDDYSEFWGALCEFFAYIVIYARQYKHVPTQPILFREFLDQRGLVTTGVNTNGHRQELFKNFMDEFAKRGTLQIFYRAPFYVYQGEYATAPANPHDKYAYWNTEEEQGYMYNEETGEWEPITLNDGEFLRLIGCQDNEEFIAALLNPSNTGWCIGWSSPTWDTTQTILNVNKDYENTIDVEDIEKYPVTSGVVKSAPFGVNMLEFSGSGDVGIQYDGKTDKMQLWAFELDYEISFRFMPMESQVTLDFGVDAYHLGVDGNNIPQFIKITNGLLSAKDGSWLDSFSGGFQTFNVTPQEEYWFRGVMKNTSASIDDEACLNFPNSTPLIAFPVMTNFCPRILQRRTSSSQPFYVYDLKIKPRLLPFTQGYFGKKNIILVYGPNNSKLSTLEVENFTKDNLFSYRNLLVFNNLSSNNYLNILPFSIELNTAGDAQELQIVSNTEWKIT